MKTFRRRVRSASRRVGGSNCDLKSNLSSLSSFLFFYSSVCHCLCERFHAFKIGGDIFKRKKKFVFVRSVTSIPLCFYHSVGNHTCKVLSEHQPTLKKVFFFLQFKILSTWNCRRLLFRLFFLHQNMLSHEHSCFAGKNAVVGKLK